MGQARGNGVVGPHCSDQQVVEVGFALLKCNKFPYALYQKQRNKLLVCKLAPIHRGQGETKERGRHSRWAGGRCNKQGNLHGLCWWLPREYTSAPARILKFIGRP